jgi:methyltransferase (TIGR00027 family)
MLSGQASTSLLRTVIRRAAHQILDRPLIFRDPLAVGLVPEASEEAIRANIKEHATPFQTLYRSGWAFRSRFSEDRLGQAAARNVGQYVIVGAGLDTFPWRRPAFAEAIEIFYVDHPASLEWTRARIRERGLPTPANLTYVGADLEMRELAEQLSDLGFERTTSAFFSMLGVTQYVSADALAALFGFVASLPTGSEIVFSFVPPDDELFGEDLAAAANAVALYSSASEPWVTRLRASQMIDHFRRLGFSDVFHLTPAHAQQLYFAGRHDKLRPSATEQLIAAMV